MPFFKLEFNGYAVQFSPFDDRIAVATAQNFGIIGNGKQYVLQVHLQYATELSPKSGSHVSLLFADTK